MKHVSPVKSVTLSAVSEEPFIQPVVVQYVPEIIDFVPELPIQNIRASSTPLRSSGITTPNGGILITNSRIGLSGSVTPSDVGDERRLGKRVRFNILNDSDEEKKDTAKNFKQKDNQEFKSRSQIDDMENEGIINEPRLRKRAKITEDDEEEAKDDTSALQKPKRKAPAVVDD